MQCRDPRVGVKARPQGLTNRLTFLEADTSVELIFIMFFRILSKAGANFAE